MKIKLLAEHPSAIPTIARWYFDEWGHIDPTNSYEKTCERIQSKLNTDILPLHLIALNEENNELLGVAQLKIREMDIYPEYEYWLGGVFVSKNARKQGIASKLVEAAINKAKTLNIKTLYLQTESKDDGCLYGKLGWRGIEQVNYHNVDVLVMKNNIS